jgi:cytosine/adenosine deaminase-related metal-dependent hydrolase
MTAAHDVLDGQVLSGSTFEPVPGTVRIAEGRIAAIEEVEDGTASDRVVLPALVNAHSHVGDAVAMEAGRGLSLDDRVAPPDGLKHRLLREADRDDQVAAMRTVLARMQRCGVAATVDFREGGVEGVERLRAAADGLAIDAVAFGRGPSEVLDVADGYGASGARDDDFAEERAAAREREKPFGIHAGERDGDDVDGALALEPDHLVHMVHARDEDLDWLAERHGTDDEVPVAVCPRSNLVTDVGLPPVEALQEATSVALGTDNAMLVAPNLWREMAFVSLYYDVSDEAVLAMATRHGRAIAGMEGGVIEEGAPADLVVLHREGALAGVDDPVAGVVRRAGPSDVERVILGGETVYERPS